MQDSWSPKQYQKFEHERKQPFYDLLKLIHPENNMRVLDLGCGTGHLTEELHLKLNAQYTLGIDSSSSMLRESVQFQNDSLSFQNCTIEEFSPSESYDLIFSNATFQWVQNHPELFKRLRSYLSPHGQWAFQMPDNFDYPTHVLAKELGKEAPFKMCLDHERIPSVLKIEQYADLCYKLGFKEMHVREQIYPHLLPSTDSLVEWVQGSLLTFYQSQLPTAKYQEFLELYIERVKTFFGDLKPLFLPFKRQLIWAKL